MDLGDVVLNILSLVAGYLISRYFHNKQALESKQQAVQQYEDLKNFVIKNLDWQAELLSFMSTVEGKNIEGEGRIAIERDEQGKPI